MIFEQKLDKVIDDDKAWNCYINTKTWTKWDPALKRVEVEGELEKGKKGVKYMKSAPHPVAFIVEEINEKKSLVLSTQAGAMKVRQQYAIEDHHMVWRIDIQGGEEKQMQDHMEKMSKSLSMQMNRLSMMIRPMMVNRKEALQMFFEKWKAPKEVEEVALMDSLRRTLACDLYAKVTLPMYRVSMMDGIAVRSKDFEHGLPDTSNWQEGKEYVRADTGDDFPDEYDAIIMIEKVIIHEDGSLALRDLKGVKAGDFTKVAGSTIKEGDLLLKKGSIIRPTDLAVLATGNYDKVPVVKKPVVAIIPTGSELVSVGSEVKRGENIDSNSFMLHGQLKELGADVICYPFLKDNKEKINERLEQALQEADIVMINGGSSKGGEDYNIQLLHEKGEVLCHNVSAVPGRPIAICLIDGKAVINIPGPALGAYFATDWCIRAILDQWFEHKEAIRHTVKAKLMEPMKNGGPVQILHRMKVERTSDGYEAYPQEMAAGQAAVLGANGQYVSDFFEEGHEIGDIIEVEIID